MSDTLATIQPIILATYGKGSMPQSLAEHLATRIDNYEPRLELDEDRERMVRDVCWNWFSGGSTAESVARKIEAALAEGEAA